MNTIRNITAKGDFLQSRHKCPSHQQAWRSRVMATAMAEPLNYKLPFELKGNLTTTHHPAQPLLRTRHCLDNSNMATVT